MNDKPITLAALFRFNRRLPHQLAAISELELDLLANGYGIAMRRDRPWFATWSQAGKQTDLAAGLHLIRKYEGCRLKSYPDPGTGGSPWTIGFGNTRYSDGRAVQPGDVITQAQADAMLAHEVQTTCNKLAKTIPHWKEMNANQQGALLSFAFNVGHNFFGSGQFNTITRALKEKRWADIPEALYLYRNPGSRVEAGLAKRRKQEGHLWITPP
jgi:GH24 family phage-related lysozyme (muramidase)